MSLWINGSVWSLWEWLCPCGLMEVFGACDHGYVPLDSRKAGISRPNGHFHYSRIFIAIVSAILGLRNIGLPVRLVVQIMFSANLRRMCGWNMF
jgi:hypothetical protein